MKFQCSVDIHAPLEKVLALFDDFDNLKEWQDGFISAEPLSGTPGEPGAKTKMIYQIGKRKIELIETVEVKDLPEEFTGTYEAKTMINRMSNHFSSIDENSTRYIAEIEYTAFRGFIPKLMAFFFPGMFRRQTQKWLDQFKAFVERESAKEKVS